MGGESFFGGAIDLAKHMATKQEVSSQPGYDDVTHGIDVLDSEMLEIEKIVGRMRERAERSVSYQGFQTEIKDRFAQIGFVVDVLWYETNIPGTLMPEIVIKGRTERKAFDRERMAHEVTSDILNMGTGGVIKTDKGKVAALMDGSYKGSLDGVHKH